jgi:hypothetical protein
MIRKDSYPVTTKLDMPVAGVGTRGTAVRRLYSLVMDEIAMHDRPRARVAG